MKKSAKLEVVAKKPRSLKEVRLDFVFARAGIKDYVERHARTQHRSYTAQVWVMLEYAAAQMSAEDIEPAPQRG